MTDAEVLHWVEEHVTTIFMKVTGNLQPDRFEVTWIDRSGSHREKEVCQSLRELAERHPDE